MKLVQYHILELFVSSVLNLWALSPVSQLAISALKRQLAILILILCID
jgi:hypothetical protein